MIMRRRAMPGQGGSILDLGRFCPAQPYFLLHRADHDRVLTHVKNQCCWANGTHYRYLGTVTNRFVTRNGQGNTLNGVPEAGWPGRNQATISGITGQQVEQGV